MTDTARVDFGPARAALYSPEAEEAVLGCVLINPETYFEVAPFLTADDFHLHKHRWVWDAFARLHDQRLPVDLLTVAEELQRRNQLDEAGGTAYLTHLINTVPTSLHAEAYGRIVQRNALRRRLLEAASAVAKLAYDEERDIGEVVGDAEAAVFAVSEQRAARDSRTAGEVAGGFVEHLRDRVRQGATLGLSTGYDELDRVLGGLHSSDLTLVAGRPGSGKTSLMLNIAYHIAQALSQRVAVFSMEMSGEQVMMRLLAQATGIDAQRLRLGQLHEREWPLLDKAAAAMNDLPLVLDDAPELTPLQVRVRCRRLDQALGLDLVVVDYVQMMRGDGRTENRTQEVGNVALGLKQLARELNVPVLAGAQLSRAVEQRGDRRPILSDLRESGDLENHADNVLFIYRPNVYASDQAEIIVAKQRNGPTHPGIPLRFRGAQTKFENASP